MVPYSGIAEIHRLNLVQKKHPRGCSVVYYVIIWNQPQLLKNINLVPNQAPLFMEFSQQEYWSGLPFSTSGDLPDSGIEPVSCTVDRQILQHCAT